MKIGLITDAPKHNLALMKISTYHKQAGNEVIFKPALPRECDLIYGSWLFHPLCETDIAGGPGYDPTITLNGMSDLKPDYSLYPKLNMSLGYTWAYCPRNCPFCIVGKQNNPKIHKSIWTFHDKQFKTICLLNNNIFSDPDWLKTFEEIWEANLIVNDENGYDARLLDDQKAEALKRTRFLDKIHFAWDLMKDERQILRGLQLAKDYRLSPVVVYVLTNYNTTEDEDIYRCQVITNFGFDPYVMPYRTKDRKPSRRKLDFKRFIDTRTYRKIGIAKAWKEYRPQ
jgi:hypothetical protein